jgi:hypothetical protein
LTEILEASIRNILCFQYYRDPLTPSSSLYVEEFAASAATPGGLMKRSFLRQLSGLSQYALAHQAGIPRMRISLSELGQLTLSLEEQSRIRRVLLNAIDERVKQLLTVLTQERVSEDQAHRWQLSRVEPGSSIGAESRAAESTDRDPR